MQVVAPHVGGSFGMKTATFPEDFVGAVLTRKLGRPVKWLQDRQDDLSLMQGRDFHFDVQIAFNNEGDILGVKLKAFVNIGAYALWVATAGLDAGGAGHHMMGPYRIKHYAYRHQFGADAQGADHVLSRRGVSDLRARDRDAAGENGGEARHRSDRNPPPQPDPPRRPSVQERGRNNARHGQPSGMPGPRAGDCGL